MTAPSLLNCLSFAGTSPRSHAWVATAIYFALSAAVIAINAPDLPAWVFLIYGLVTIGQSAILVRRFHDMGRTGWWAVTTGVPVIGLIPLAWALIAKPGAAEPDRFAWRTAYSWGLVALCVWGALICLRAVWVPFWIPSGSMKPALLPGDYVISRRISGDRVQPGDVVVFQHPQNHQIYVKRVIGRSGDTIDLRDAKLSVNATPAQYTALPDFEETNARQGPLGLRPRCFGVETCRKTQRLETLPSGSSYAVLDIAPSPLDTFQTTVPAKHVVVMGDNRDNSIDSRVPLPDGLGPIPVGKIYARVERIVFSSNGSLIDPRKWRPGRYWIRVP